MALRKVVDPEHNGVHDQVLRSGNSEVFPLIVHSRFRDEILMAFITHEAQMWDLPPPDPGVTDLQPWPTPVDK